MKKRLLAFFETVELVDTIIALVGIGFILLSALYEQIFQHEQPCPLCLLQRAAFINIGIALIMNLRYRNKVAHWAIVVLSAFMGMIVSIRQILLHITSIEGYGNPVFGLHLYTWCFLFFSIALVGSAIMLLIYPER